MERNIIYFLFLNFFSLTVSGQPGPYSLMAIPEAIKTKASIIIHVENIDLEVENLEKATLKVHKIFTVLNEEGKKALAFNEYSSKFISLEEAEIKVFDSNGKVKEKYKKKDMRTMSVGEGLIEDGYVTYYQITTTTYPLTVEFNYEQKIKSTLLIPDYRFMDTDEGIIESNYTVRVPAEIGLRYKSFNTSIRPEISEEGKYKVYKWVVRNLPPIEYEEGMASARSKYPYIAIVADNFSYYGFPGDLSTWKSFGLWIKDLYKDLDILPADRQQFFTQLVKDAATEKEKVNRIYNYLQQNFRYVSIQLGVGGLKPFSAEFTDQKKYGDCKALSNYMKAALKSVGIKSYVAIINAEYNEEPVDPDFPSNDFNHVILCVPAQKDSIWLECTSSTVEFGELGTFTENKNALLITDDGGKLVSTPKSQSTSNIFSTVTNVSVSDDLSAETETIFTTKGEYRQIMNDILKEKKDHQKEAIVFYFGFKQPDDFELSGIQSSGAFKSELKMAIAKVPEFSAGSKLFINPRVHKMWLNTLPKPENRKFDFYFHFPFEKYDTTIYKIPAGLKPDVLLKEKEIKCDYAFYKSTCWYKETENSIYSATTLILKQHKIPAAGYASVKKFFDNVMLDDAQRIVLKKTETEKKAF
jgi:transglutaminase-like putative cysteine protease